MPHSIPNTLPDMLQQLRLRFHKLITPTKLKQKQKNRPYFTPTDAWNFCDWYPRIGAAALRYLALHNDCYPDDFHSLEKWRAYLNELASKLEQCCDGHDPKNEYEDEYMNERKNALTTQVDENGNMIHSYNFSEVGQQIQDKYFERERELAAARQQFIEETFAEVGRNLHKLWD